MLSVILPSFNDEKKISLALSPALEVQYVNEIIIVDDCSTDGTENLIKKLQYKFKKIKYFKNKENLGSGLSFIEGLKNSTNKYLIMLNSDDFFIPKGIEKLFKYQIKFNLDVAYGKMAIKKSSGVFKYSHPGYKNYSYSGGRNELVGSLIHDMYMPSFGTIIKKNVLKDFYNKNYYKKLICEYGGEFKAHDYDLFINLAKKRKNLAF